MQSGAALQELGCRIGDGAELPLPACTPGGNASTVGRVGDACPACEGLSLIPGSNCKDATQASNSGFVVGTQDGATVKGYSSDFLKSGKSCISMLMLLS